MIHVLLRSADDRLIAYAENPEECRAGSYWDEAPALLELPADRVRWVAEDPLGMLWLDVPGEFVALLLAGKPAEAGRILQHALATRGPVSRCLVPEVHQPHEWFTHPSTYGRQCDGKLFQPSDS